MDGTDLLLEKEQDLTKRPWYVDAQAAIGHISIVGPYQDVKTGQTVITLSKTLCDVKSVIAMDFSMDILQERRKAEVAERQRQYAEKQAEQKRIEAERRAEEERQKAARRAEQEQLRIQKKAEKEMRAAERKAESAARRAEQEQKRAQKKAERATRAAERKMEMQAKKAEKQAERATRNAARQFHNPLPRKTRQRRR